MAAPVENPGYVSSAVLQRLAAVTKQLKRRMTKLLQIKPGAVVLDVGCGPATDTIPMARLVGKDGLVVGVDYDEALVAEANRRAVAAGVAAWTQHVVSDASLLPYPSNTFDACRSERVFQHVTDSTAVLQEMVRVTKPQGRIAVADSDWCSLSIDTPEIAIERRVVRCLPDMLCNGYVGRQLIRMFYEQSIKIAAVEVHPIIWTDYQIFSATSFSIADLQHRIIESRKVSREELERFLSSLEEADRRGVFFASGNLVLVAGVRAM